MPGKWSPYISGPRIAAVLIASFYILDSPLGISEGYQVMSDYCRKSIENRKVDEYPPLIWQTAFLAGIFIGALAAAIAAKSFKFSVFPEDRKTKGIVTSSWLTPIQGVAGGFLVMLGLLIAGDSFIGLWAGAIQLSTGAWIFLFSIVIWGVIFTGLLSAKYTPPEVSKEGESSESGKKK
jgi:hypothetical protein